METVYIGIDPTAGRRPMDYAVLDGELRILARGAGDLETMLPAVLAYPRAVTAVGAPQSLNAGLMLQPARRERYGLPPKKPTWGRFKVCEYELRRRGIRLQATPAELTAAPRWMQAGLELYDRLRAAGYQPYEAQSPAPLQFIEVHPQASFTVLLGRLPYARNTLEGRLQRQALLYDVGVKAPDPMDTVEEITRHHLLAGNLRLENLLLPAELDALISAYTAQAAAREPGQVTRLGDPAEGQIVAPVAPDELQAVYHLPKT